MLAERKGEPAWWLKELPATEASAEAAAAAEEEDALPPPAVAAPPESANELGEPRGSRSTGRLLLLRTSPSPPPAMLGPPSELLPPWLWLLPWPGTWMLMRTRAAEAVEPASGIVALRP